VSYPNISLRFGPALSSLHGYQVTVGIAIFKH